MRGFRHTKRIDRDAEVRSSAVAKVRELARVDDAHQLEPMETFGHAIVQAVAENA